jgi:hypothetical protein
MNDITIESLSGATIASMSPQEAGAALAAFEAAARGPAAPANPTTPAEAKQRLDSLSRDATFRSKLLAGDDEATKQFNALTAMTAEDAAAPVDLALAGVVPFGIETLTAENPLSTRQLATAAEAMRAQGLNEDCIKEALIGAKSSPEIYRAALNRRAERLGDKEWVSRLLAGGFVENKEYVLLSSILAGEVVAA